MTGNRAKFTIIAAVFAVAMMMIVPVSVSFDSEARFASNEIGYCIEATNPTEQELTDYNIDKDEEVGGILEVIFTSDDSLLKILNGTIYDTPTTTMTTFIYTEAGGDRISTLSEEYIGVTKVKAEGVTIKLPVTTAGKIVSGLAGLNDEEAKVLKAIDTYFGSAAVGDEVRITGSIDVATSSSRSQNYDEVNAAQVVITRNNTTFYIDLDMQLKIELIKAGEQSGKSINLDLNGKLKEALTATYTYSEVASKLTNLSECFVSYNTSLSNSIKANFTVNGTAYELPAYWEEPVLPAQKTVADIKDVSTITVDHVMETKIKTLLPSSDNVKVGKEFSDAKAAFNDVKNEVDPEKKNYTPFIIGGAIAAVVIIGAVAALLIVKKKKAKAE